MCNERICRDRTKHFSHSMACKKFIARRDREIEFNIGNYVIVVPMVKAFLVQIDLLCNKFYDLSTWWRCDMGRLHYIDVIMTTMASQITSLTVVYSTVNSDADLRKHQSSASLAFVWGIHRERWIPRTKGQLGGKCFHLMTSSCSVLLTLQEGNLTDSAYKSRKA